VTEPLTDAEAEMLLTKLQSLAHELETALSSSEGSDKPVDLDEPIGRLSRMDAIQQQKMAAASRIRLRSRLKAVDAALGRVEAGVYGDCALCDDPIGVGRLRARPETPLCMPCQAEGETRR